MHSTCFIFHALFQFSVNGFGRLPVWDFERQAGRNCMLQTLLFSPFCILCIFEAASSPGTLIEYAIYAAICKRKWLLPRIIIVHHERGELRS